MSIYASGAPGATLDDVAAPTPLVSHELGRSQGTDFFDVNDLLTDEERSIRDRVRAFSDEEVIPIANAYWERGEFARELVPKYAELRVAGGAIRGYECPGMSPIAEGLVAVELARGDGSFSTFNSVHSGLVMASINLLGSAEQRERWLPAMARCEKLGAFALTEPDHGSDVVSLATEARRKGDSWLLNGCKRWIGNGSIADLVLVWARDEDGRVGGFVVEREGGSGPAGYDATVIKGKTSNRALWQAEIRMENVRVPLDNRLAGAKSFGDTAKCLTKSRQTIAWEALGHAIAAYECALAYAKRRIQFGRPIASFQLVQDKLSHMVADITGMQLTCLRLAQLEAAGRARLEHAALAKLNTASGARRVCAMARDILGGNGILLDHHVARHHADVEAVYTYEGTDTVQSLIVGRAVTGLSAFA
jgi:glutaryl-CoA dehydrogenase